VLVKKEGILHSKGKKKIKTSAKPLAIVQEKQHRKLSHQGRKGAGFSVRTFLVKLEKRWTRAIGLDLLSIRNTRL